MIDWTELRTAYKVSLLGTVSTAADELGIHRASVVRHIDSVEKQLGQKIFIRSNRGYQSTDNGAELFKVAELTESQLNRKEVAAAFPTTSVGGPGLSSGLNVAIARPREIGVRFTYDF